jgi:hypothetical protein
MKKTAGHLIRMCGLLIEMLGVWGVYSSTGENDHARIQLPGGSIVPLAWLVVALGFVIWLTGTIIVYGSRKNRRPRQMDDKGL